MVQRSQLARNKPHPLLEGTKMSRFLSTLEGAGGLDIIREVYIGTEKYLLFTRYAEAESQWQIGWASLACRVANGVLRSKLHVTVFLQCFWWSRDLGGRAQWERRGEFMHAQIKNSWKICMIFSGDSSFMQWCSQGVAGCGSCHTDLHKIIGSMCLEWKYLGEFNRMEVNFYNGNTVEGSGSFKPP